MENVEMKALALVFAVVCPVGVAHAEELKRMWAESFYGQKAPELVVEKWVSRKPDIRGKFVLLEFWATWCGPCRQSISKLNKFHEKFGGRLLVIGISDESAEKIAKFKSPAINYYSAVDTRARTYDQYKILGIPHAVIIDPKGIVRWEGFPLLPGHELTEKVIKKILSNPAYE